MLKIKIKSAAITNLTDARYFAAWDVEWLGFCLDNNASDFLSPIEVKAIKEWVEGPKIIGEFGQQSVDEIQNAIDNIGLDAIQIGHFSDPSIFQKEVKVPLFKEYILESADELEKASQNLMSQKNDVYCFVLDGSKNNLSWKNFIADQNKSLFIQLCKQTNIILDIIADPSDINEMLKFEQLFGLQIKGGEEEKVGFKSFDEIDNWFDQLIID